ncbi:MAG: hypothetical protein ACK4TA_11715 [Saprospiraceae bacterium]
MRYTLTLPLLLCCFHLFAQTNFEKLLNTATVTRVERFHLDSLTENQVFLRMPYASSQFLNFLRPGAFRNADLERIELVYTAFPVNNIQGQRRLNLRRLQALERRLNPGHNFAFANLRLIEQTPCPTEKVARQLPHGFLLTFSEADDLPDFTVEQKLEELTEGDSTVLNTLNRNKDWQKMLVVTDLTGSMSPYTAQLLLWFKLAQNTGRVQHLVFFNDGDGKADTLKTLGKTGGIYDLQPKSFEEIAILANKVVEKGTGGDEPENNIEALLHGINACPECNEIIMISDNWASPRDLALLKKVNKPVRVILCGTEEGVNPDYLNLARDTGGSVHTIREDIENLLSLNEGQEIKIGNEIFVIRRGRFELFKKI